MRLKPAMRYQLREYLVAGGFFWGISVVLMLLSIWLPLHFQLDEYQVYSWYGFSCTIFFFVFGIVLPRQATRLCVQMGVSRRTAYLSLYLMAAVASLCMAVAGQVLMLIGNAVAAQTPFGTGLQDFLVGLFQTLYRNGGTMTALDQALAVVFTAFCMLALFSFGLFFTFLFWRLSKVRCIVAALAIPVVLTGVPALFATFAQALSPLTFLLQQVGQFFAASPWGGIVVFLVVTAFFGWIGWMLIRRTNIRGGMLSRQ